MADNVRVRSVAFYAYGFRKTDVSGLVTYVRSMRDALEARGVGVRVLTRDAEPNDPNAEILAPGAFTKRASKVAARLARGAFGPVEEQIAIAQRAYQLDAHGGPSLYEIEEHAGLAGLLVRAPLRAPVIVRMHGPHFLVAAADNDPDLRAVERLDKLEKSVAARAAGLTVPSHDTLRRIRKHWQLELPSARVIPNTTPMLPDSECWAGDTHGPILFVGRSDRLKGFDLVVRAFAQIAAEHTSRELWLVGPERELRDGSRVYDRVSDFLNDVLPDQSVRARVHYLGAKSPDEVRALRQKAAFVLVASRFETFCLAAVEAMMAGCPLIVPDASALAEIVDHEETGLKFETESPGALAIAMQRMLQNPGLSRELGQRARQRAISRYAPDSVIDQTLDFYEQVVSARSKAPPTLLTRLRGARP